MRPNWHTQVQTDGLVYVDTELAPGDVVSYWRESEHYVLTESETDRIAWAANELFRMCIAAGDHIIEHNLFARLGIPPWAVKLIKETWKDDDPYRYHPMLYGRFDLRLENGPDGTINDIKLYEFNADTPTSLVESAVIQWNWLIMNHPDGRYGQWNDLYEKLVEAWEREISRWQARANRKVSVVHFAHTSAETSGEDMMTVGLMASAAEEAAKKMGVDGQPAFTVKFLYMEDIKQVTHGEYIFTDGHNGTEAGYFLDSDGEKIEMIFKLYPWEWLVNEAFGKTACWNALQSDGTVWIEPAYKMLWSNKGLLPVLWQLYKDDPVRSQWLLPAYFEGEEPPGFKDNCARKPLLSREGANVSLIQNGKVIERGEGDYGAEGFILQQLLVPPGFTDEFENKTYHPVAGVWMVSDEAVALCFRESLNRITNNVSYFVPHLVRKGV